MSEIGMIMAWAGSEKEIPAKWLLCDGATVSSRNYPKLFRVLGDKWGEARPNEFKLPDLRGRFLRGLSEGYQTGDPDWKSRYTYDDQGQVKLNSPYKGVGTYQDDAIQKHSHQLSHKKGKAINFWIRVGPGSYSLRNGSNRKESSKVGIEVLRAVDIDKKTRVSTKETRPKNASVAYIIKAL